MAVDAWGNDSDVSRRWWRSLMTIGVAVGALGLLSLWSYPILHPGVWDEVAIAAGLREPTAPVNGLYRLTVHGLFQCLPSSAVLKLLPWLGRIAMAGSTAAIYGLFVEVLPSTWRLTVHVQRLGNRIAYEVALLAALMFLVSDPFWRAGQTFSPTTLFIMENVMLWTALFLSIHRGKVWPLYVCATILGMLAASSIWGWLLTGVAVWVLLRSIAGTMGPNAAFVHPMMDSLVRDVTLVRLCNTWLLVVVAQLVADYWLFRDLGGWEAAGCQNIPDYLVAWLKAVGGELSTSATAVGWLFAVVICGLPLVVVMKSLPRALNDDRFMPYGLGLAFAVSGLVALAQVSGYKPLMFWLWGQGEPMVGSDQLLVLLLAMSVVTSAFTLTVFGVDSFCRNYKRLARQNYPESVGTPVAMATMVSFNRNRRFHRRLFALSLILIPGLLLWGRRQIRERGMMQIMGDYAEELLAELGPRQVLFTDGSYDSWLELCAKGRGKTLWTLSLMASNSPAETWVRLRAADNDENRALLERGAAATLRSWLATKSPHLEGSGVQLGFEFWKREGVEPPPLSGLMALPGGQLSSAETTRANAVCEELGDRIHALDRKGSLADCMDREVRRLFPYVVWRLARMAIMHGRALDRAGKRVEAMVAAETADGLNAVNYALVQLYRDTRWMTRQSSGVLMPTPREGLVIGLVRADFVLAAQFAQPILKADPDDPRANFAVGMKYYMEDQYTRAEHHLVRCLKRRPAEPAVLNNLAMVQLKLDKLECAEANARKALAILPASREIKRTLDSVIAARGKKLKATP